MRFECLAHLLTRWRELLIDDQLVMRPRQRILMSEALYGWSSFLDILKVRPTVEVILFRGWERSPTSADILIKNRPYRLIMLTTILVEAAWSHVEVLDLQVFYPVFLRLIMISQLDQLIIDILNRNFLIVLKTTTTLIIEAAILGITLDHLALDWLWHHSLQLLTIVPQDCFH